MHGDFARKPLGAQRAPVLVSVAVFYIPASLVLAAVVMASAATQTPTEHITRDPAAVTGSPFFTGALSNAGVALWAAAAATCFLSASLSRISNPKREDRFLLEAGAFTGWLLLDDMLLIHENVVPKFLGLPGWTLFPIYAMALTTILFRHRRRILASDYALLGLSGCFLGGSLSTDLVIDSGVLSYDGRQFRALGFLEDALKFVGIAGWLAYFVRAGRDAIEPHVAPRPAADAADAFLANPA